MLSCESKNVGFGREFHGKVHGAFKVAVNAKLYITVAKSPSLKACFSYDNWPRIRQRPKRALFRTDSCAAQYAGSRQAGEAGPRNFANGAGDKRIIETLFEREGAVL